MFAYGKMTPPTIPPLASTEAIRPVFLIVMGAFLLLFAWRLSRNSGGWAGRFMIGGAFLLAFGYMIVIPMYEAGFIRMYHAATAAHPQAENWLGWHVVKLCVMNLGWFFFGTGLGIHSGLLRFPALHRSISSRPPALFPARESAV